jgi:hypothetical protein
VQRDRYVARILCLRRCTCDVVALRPFKCGLGACFRERKRLACGENDIGASMLCRYSACAALQECSPLAWLHLKLPQHAQARTDSVGL